MARRNGIFVFLVLPIIILLFSIGWSLFWIGSQRKSDKTKKVSTPSILKFFVLSPEKEQEEIQVSWILSVRQMTVSVSKRQKYSILLERTQKITRRNKYDIFANILAACIKCPRTQSWLIGHLRLSTSLAKSSLRFLVAAKLIEATKTLGMRATIYATTRKGKNALEKYAILTTRYFSI